MLANDVTLVNATFGAGDISELVSLISIVDRKSVRSAPGAITGESTYLTVSHSEVERGKDSVGKPVKADRHLVRIDHTATDVDGIAATASVYLVIEEPRSVITAARLKAMIDQLVTLLYSSAQANLIKVLNSEP